MATFSQKQLDEINTIIKAIEAEIKPKMEIGAKDRAILTSLLKASKIDKMPKHFKCKREYSDAIISFFVKEKAIPRSRFSSNSQTSIFLL